MLAVFAFLANICRCLVILADLSKETPEFFDEIKAG